MLANYDYSFVYFFIYVLLTNTDKTAIIPGM